MNELISLLLERPRKVRVELDLSASDNLITASLSISLSAMNENELRQQVGYG
jgi:hypothetical protein